MVGRPGRIALAIATAVLLSAPLVVGPVAGGAAAGPAPVAATGSVDSANLTYDELRGGGRQISGAAPSTRYVGGSGSLYVDHEHANPLRNSGGEEWQVQKLLRPGATVNVNELRFHAQGSQSAGSREYTLHVVYWQLAERSVERGNRTVTQRYADNVTTTTKTLSFPRPFGTSTVDLRPHYGEPVEVTMWLEQAPESARWRFTHHSLSTTQGVSTDTAGERLWWLFTNFGLWVMGFAIPVFGGIFAAKRRASTPDKGTIWWLIVVLLAGGGILLFAYSSLAELFVDAPQVLAGVIVALIGIPILEHETGVRKVAFAKPELVDATTASGKEGVDSVDWQLEVRKVTRLPGGVDAVLPDGKKLRRWLARVAGGACVLEGMPDFDERFDVSGGSTSIDELVFSRASASQALYYEPEGWTLGVPSGSDELLKLGLSSVVLAVLGSVTVGMTLLGALAYPALHVRPVKGRAYVEAADAHMRAAYVTMLYGSVEFDNAETLESAREELVRATASKERDVQGELDRQDATLVEETLTDGDLSLAVEDVEPSEDVAGNGEDSDDSEDGDGGPTTA
jgi:hypothetical protein